MRKNAFIFGLIFIFSFSISSFGQSYCSEYKTATNQTQRVQIIAKYIKDYCNIAIDLNKLSDINKIQSIEDIISKNATKLKDFDEAIEARKNGSKVIFFVGDLDLGGLNAGTEDSGNWGRKMPKVTVFYWSKNQCSDENKGLNWFCGKPGRYEFRFYKINSK
jgi:hypothetical protein